MGKVHDLQRTLFSRRTGAVSSIGRSDVQGRWRRTRDIDKATVVRKAGKFARLRYAFIQAECNIDSKAMKPNKIILATMILFLGTSAGAATFYVDNQNPVASDTNPGTEALPFRLIQACANIVRAGDLCDIYPGNYNERLNLTQYSGQIGSPIIFQAHNVANKDNPANNTVMRGWFLRGVSNIIVRGFEITHIGSGSRSGIYLRNASNIIVEENYLHELEPDISLGGGIDGDGNNSYVKILNNTLYKVEGIGITVLGNQWLVEGNEVSYGRDNRLSDGVVILNDSDAMRFFGNGHVIRNNYLHDYLWADQKGRPHLDAIMTFANAEPSGTYSYDTIVENNVIKNFDDQIFINNDIVPGTNFIHHITFRNNVFMNAGFIGGYGTGGSYFFNLYDLDYATVVNNVFAITDSQNYNGHPFRAQASVSAGKEGAHHLILKNNIFYGFKGNDYLIIDTPSLVGSEINNNIWNVNPTWPPRIPGQDSNSLFGVDPKFADVLLEDFHLAINSPAIDYGANLPQYVVTDKDGISRPQGPAWDIGVYEFVSGSPPANQPPSISITSPLNATTYSAPATVTINAAASDSNGSVSKVEFFSGAALLGMDTTAPYSFNWANVAAGTYNLTAKATDNEGASATSGAISIIVNTSGQPIPDDDLDRVQNAIDHCPKTAVAARPYVNVFGCALPIATKFDIKPDFNATDINGLQNLELGISQFGKISYTNKNIRLVKMSVGEDDRLNIDADLNISQNKITLNQNNLPQLNTQATITLNNINFTTPKILRDGVECASCLITGYDRNSKTIVFSVPGF